MRYEKIKKKNRTLFGVLRDRRQSDTDCSVDISLHSYDKRSHVRVVVRTAKSMRDSNVIDVLQMFYHSIQNQRWILRIACTTSVFGLSLRSVQRMEFQFFQ